MSSKDLPGCRSQRRKHRRPLLRFAAIWILLILACRLPGQGISTPSFPATRTPAPPTAAPAAAQPTTAVPQGALPPALVEVRPPQGSLVRPEEGFTLVFSRPMNRAAVEAAVQTSPALSGSFRWAGDATVTFLPQTPLPVDSSLTLTVSTAAQSQDGLPLARMVDLNFRTPPALTLTGRQPAPDVLDVNPQGALIVTFNQPVGGENAQPAFKLDPPVDGQGAWQTAGTYAFTPDPGLQGGQTYTVALDPSLAARMGDTADAQTTWRFTTLSPHLLTMSPGRQGLPLDPDTTFNFTFNQAVDRASLEDSFNLLGADGYPVHGAFRWSGDSTQVTFDPDVLLLRNTSYYLTLTGETTSASGQPFPELPYQAGYLTAALPKLVNAKPANGGTLALQQGLGQVALQFNVPLSEQALDQQVTLEPPVERMALAAAEDTLTLSGAFQPGTHYTLSLSPDLTDRWNKPLGETVLYTFQTTPSQPSLTLPSVQPGTTAFVRPSTSVLEVQAEGLPGLNISTAGLSWTEYLRFANSPSNQWQLPDERWSTWSQPLEPAATAVDVPLSEDGGPLPPGLYVVRIAAEALPLNQQPQPFLVASTNRNLILRREPGAAQVWAVSLEDVEPVGAAEVSFYDGQGNPVGSLTTGTNGLGRLESSALDSAGSKLYARIGKPGEMGFALAAAEMEPPKAEPKSVPMIQGAAGAAVGAFIETDRQVYQPGETVHFRAFLGSGGGDQTATVQFWQGQPLDSPGSRPLAEVAVALTAFETASGSYTLPLDAAPGSLTLSIAEQPETAKILRIAAPTLGGTQLTLSPKQQVLFPGQGLTVSAAAQTDSGADAGGLALNWRLLAFPEPDILPQGYLAGPVDWNWLEPGVQNGSASPWNEVASGIEKTGADGAAQIQVAADRLSALPAGVSRWQLAFAAEIRAPDGSSLARAVSRLAYQPADFSIGIQPEAGVAQAGQELGFSILSVDLSGAPKPAEKLEAVFDAVAWENGTPSDPQLDAAARPRLNPTGSVNLETGEDGIARLVFTPPSPGLYVLDVHGSGAASQALVWVGGSGKADWPALPGGGLPLAWVGQGDDLFVPNPFDGPAQALITAGAGEPQVVEIAGGGQAVALTSTQASGGLPVTVSLVGKDAGGAASLRQGSINRAEQPGLRIDLQIQGQLPQPGEPVTLLMQAKDAQGQPVAAEFSLALLDPAALAADDAAQPAYFDPALYWNGSLTTGADGSAVETVLLPERVQSWTAVARAVTEKGEIVETSLDLRPYQDLQLVPQLPGALAAGDQAALPVVLRNNTNQEQSLNVRLDAIGLALDTESPQSQTVSIPAGGQAQWTWTGRVEQTDLVTLTFTSRDRSRQVNLPVLRAADPSAFAASGALDVESERREVIGLPPGLEGAAGALRVEVAPSLAALVTGGLQDISIPTSGLTEDALLSFAPWAAAYQSLQALGLNTDDLQARLDWGAAQSLQQLAQGQNPDGSWGFWSGLPGDSGVSSEALLGLALGRQSGAHIDPAAFDQAARYVQEKPLQPGCRDLCDRTQPAGVEPVCPIGLRRASASSRRPPVRVPRRPQPGRAGLPGAGLGSRRQALKGTGRWLGAIHPKLRR